MKGNTIPIPDNAPKKDEEYVHYKGDHYRVVDLALHSNDDEWMVVYKPLHENADAHLFTRPVREWGEEVEWGTEKKMRFSLVHANPSVA
jgi:hypothetical protein